VLRRFAASTPLKTELSVVFKIELSVVDNEEIPKVIAPSIRFPESLPKSVVLAMMML
jgi:hypothetical protein